MPRGGSRLLGRSREMAALMALLDQAEVDRADPHLVVGEAGMGKTALLDEFARAARRRGWRVARAAAPQGGEASAFAVVDDLAHCLPEHLETLSDEDSRLLRAPSRTEAVGPVSVAGALLRLLATAGDAQPLLLIVDDLQWADSGSTAALTLAVGRLGQVRVAVVAAARPRPELDPRVHAWTRIEVGPLALDASRRLLRRTLADRASSTVLDEPRAGFLAESLGRCPLALIEAGRMLSTDQLTGREELPDPLPLAERLEEAWGRSWAALPEPTRTALLALVVTQGAGPGLTARVLCDLGMTAEALDPAGADRLLDPHADARETRARLAHPLIGDAVLAAAGLPAVHAMHARAADAAEALGLPPSIVIAHLVAAARSGDSAVRARLLVEADRAEAACLGDPAVSALVAAAELSLTSRERSHLAARAARTLMNLSGDRTHFESIVGLADPRFLEPHERFWVEWARSEWLGDEDLAQGLRAVEHTAEWARRIDTPVLPWVVYSALTDAFGLLDGETALRHGRELRELAERADADARGRMPAWACRGMYAVALFQVGQVEAADAELRAVGDLSRRWQPASDDLVERLQVGVVDLNMGRLDPWVDRRMEELATLLAADPGETLGFLRRIQAERALRRGQLSAARSLVDEARLLGYGERSRAEATDRLTISVQIAADRGDRDVVDAEAAELRSGAGRIGWPQLVSAADRAQGTLALAGGRLDDALNHLEPLADVPLLGRGPWDTVPLGRADLVEALSRAGETDRAAEVATALTGILAPSTDPLARALSARLHGLITQGEPAHRAFERAIAAFGEGGDPFEQARTRLLLGELLRRERRIAPARHELRLAAAAFEGMEAPAWATRAQGELRATGARVPAPAPHALTTLTPQERRVAEAVASGASDRQVAAELFLSPRTVAYHLSSVYRKLGVSSRAALASRLVGASSEQSRDATAAR